jgi:hypothetical protein
LTANLIGIYGSIELRLHLIDRGEMGSDYRPLVQPTSSAVLPDRNVWPQGSRDYGLHK